MLRSVLIFILWLVFSVFGCKNNSKEYASYSSCLLVNDDFPSKKNYFGIKPIDNLNLSLLKYEIDYSSNHEVDSLLRILFKWDQKYRELLVERRRLKSDSLKTIVELGNKMKKVDSVNFIIISRILNNVGWPSTKFFSDSSSQSAFIILLHNTDRELVSFQEIIDSAFLNGDIINSHYAVLKDRILILKGKNQMYGTHCRKNKDGSVSFFDLQDAVDLNRKIIGLNDFKLDSCELMSF